MGRLSGFNYRQVIAKLKKVRFEFDRNAKGSHEIWWNPINKNRTIVRPEVENDLKEAFICFGIAESALYNVR